MFPVAMGGLSAGSLGVADFIASQTSERLGAARALTGMLLVSSILLTGLMIALGGFDDFLVANNAGPIALAVLHGVAMAVALLLFFYAMSVGKVSIVAPIVAAHPVFIVGVLALQGATLPVLQLLAVAIVLLGVGLVAASAGGHMPTGARKKTYARWQRVVAVSLASSVIYGVAILLLQGAGNGLGGLQTLWIARCVGLLTALSYLRVRRARMLAPSARWYALFLVHGALDSGGLLFILLGSTDAMGGAITAVVASTFPVITVGLAWLVLNERLSLRQLAGAALVFGGVAVLVGH